MADLPSPLWQFGLDPASISQKLNTRVGDSTQEPYAAHDIYAL